MILLSLEEKKAIADLYESILTLKDDRIILKSGENKSVIPSDIYPLSRGKNQRENDFRVFTVINSNNNHGEIEEDFKEVFNSMSFLPGLCYHSTEELIKKCKEKGIQDVKPYCGWLVTVDKPVHHSWVVYKDKYVIDGSMNILAFMSLMQKQAETGDKLSKERLRNHLLEHVKESEQLPNSETRIMGNIPPIFIYIGAEIDPNQGRLIFQDLMSRYPEHPSYSGGGMNGFGVSEFQKKYYGVED